MALIDKVKVEDTTYDVGASSENVSYNPAAESHTTGSVGKIISELNQGLVHIKDMTSEEEQSGTYAGYHLGFYLDINGDLCQKE